MNQNNHYSIIQNFILLAKMNNIQELSIDDIHYNFSIMKEMPEYKEILSSYEFIDGICPQITNEIGLMVSLNQLSYYQNENLISISSNYNLIEQLTDSMPNEMRILIFNMITDYILINTKKNAKRFIKY